MKKGLLATIVLLLVGAVSFAGEGESVSIRPAVKMSAAQRWHAFHGSLPFWEVIKSPPQGSGSGGVTVGGANAWTGTNSFIDANFSLLDEGDPTKIAKFQLSPISSGTTRTYTLPNGDVTLANLNQAQTWTTAVQTIGQIRSGATNADTQGLIHWNTAQTPDTNMLFTGSTANSWIIAEASDALFDFTHAAAPDPTLFIHSRNQNATQWVSLTHDGTDAFLSMGTGLLRLGNGIRVGTDTALQRHAAGVLRASDDSTATSIRGFLGGGADVASAAALPVPTGRVFHVTGTTNITSITSTNFESGAVITLIFDGVLTFTDGNNIQIAGNFVTTASDTITLVYDGTNWHEIARSVN